MGAHKDALGIAAMDVLAEHGGRGFTHRAVDKRAGVPEGTASRYARTRAALLALAADVLFSADVDETTRAIVGFDSGAYSGEEVVDGLLRATEVLMQARHRYRARVELQLEAARIPELRLRFQRARATFVKAVAGLVGKVVDADAHLVADALVTLIDGLLHRAVILDQPAFTTGQLRALLVAMLDLTDVKQNPHV